MVLLRNSLWAVGCVVGLLACGRLRAEPGFNLQTSYYDLKGGSVRELRASLNRAKPKTLARDAFTAWQVSWTYSWRQVEGGVTLLNPQVSVAVTMTLPRWTPPQDADPQLVERWQTYLRALLHHENGHTALAVQAARDIEKKLAALPRQSSVETLKQAVDNAGQQVLNEAKAKERQFDEQTQHGLKQGARFP